METQIPFDLTLAKRGYAVKTANGYPARILCFDRKGYNEMSMIVLIEYPEGKVAGYNAPAKHEEVKVYTLQGTTGLEEYRLVMDGNVRTGYIVIEFDYGEKGPQLNTHIYHSREMAEDVAQRHHPSAEVVQIEYFDIKRT